mmetsp:Transcript_127934/g.368580  ORF Transcript_127934/g.368580 Transcript_127934/m.368580 type:complete len:328 (+) Transcript_127934:67-1050(+)
MAPSLGSPASHVTADMCELERSDPLLAAGQRRRPMFPLRYPALYDMYKKIQRSAWIAEEIDPAQDAEDWDCLSSGERRFVTHALACCAASGAIAWQSLSSRFLREVRVPEARAFYSFQLALGNIHAEAYAFLLQQYVDNVHERDSMCAAVHGLPALRRKLDWAAQWISEECSFAERLVAFACVECILSCGAFCAFEWLTKKRGLLPGLLFATELISRDNRLHTEFACLVYRTLQHKLPEGVAHDIVREAVEAERGFICGAVPCDLVGLSSELVARYVEFVGDSLLVALGHGEVFGTPNPFDALEPLEILSTEADTDGSDASWSDSDF